MAEKKKNVKKRETKKEKKTKPKKETLKKYKENLKKESLKKEKKERQEQIRKENNILKGILIIVGIIVVLIIAWVIIAQSVRTFKYKSLEFEIVQEGDIIFYRTGLPTMYQGQLTEYNFYLRNDARKLDEKVAFNGNLDLKSTAVLNIKQEFTCEGKGVIAVANLLKLYQFIGIDVISDENATCDPEAKYTFIQILEGPETKIEQTGQSCYDIYINNCEILEGTERMMIETLNKVRSTIPDYKDE